MSVLLVDDQPAFRVAIRSVLEDGFDEAPEDEPAFAVVGEAADGEEAVVLASSLHPRVVLMDVRLPGITGPEATRRILEQDRSVTVVLMSTARQADLGAGLLDCGAVGFIAKEALDSVALRRLLGW